MKRALGETTHRALFDSRRCDVSDWLKRPEVLTLLVAMIVSALVALDVPQLVGLPVPVEALGGVVTLFWAVFLGALFEGAFKGADYVGSLAGLLRSGKFRIALVGLVVVVVAGFAEGLGIDVPEAQLAEVLNYFILAVLAKAGLDGFGVVIPEDGFEVDADDA